MDSNADRAPGTTTGIDQDHPPYAFGVTPCELLSDRAA
jgi:hypothetical protein